MTGLDSITADGLNAIDSLQKVIAIMTTYGSLDSWITGIKRRVGQISVHLKIHYRQNLSMESRCADHCISYSLSDRTEPSLTRECNHIHDIRCEECESLKNVASDILNEIGNLQAPPGVLDELRYDTNAARTHLARWRAHILRACQQDRAKHNILEQMPDSAGMIFLDFAMKFLPRTHHETQQDFFAKKGISWHVSVLVRKVDGEYTLSAFYHVLQNGLQDWFAVVSIIYHLAKHLKVIHPHLDTLFIRSDNAGCYHSAATILSIPSISAKTGMLIKRYDFSEPCYGKDICDRRTAPVKMHVINYVHAGNDVTNAFQLSEAIQSYGGVQATTACVGSMHKTPKEKPGPWKGISKYNNFEFTR
jgi:hypothetical protein